MCGVQAGEIGRLKAHTSLEYGSAEFQAGHYGLFVLLSCRRCSGRGSLGGSVPGSLLGFHCHSDGIHPSHRPRVHPGSHGGGGGGACPPNLQGWGGEGDSEQAKTTR